MATITKWFSDDYLYKKYYPQNPLYKRYQEQIWNIPPHNDLSIFEQYTIGLFAAGLSWNASFLKSPELTKAYHHWDLERITQMGSDEINGMLQNKGLIRNKRKMLATIHNADVALKIQRRYGSLDNYFWQMVDYRQDCKQISTIKELGTTSPVGDRIAKRMKKDGFKYAGPVSVYSFIISIGLIHVRLDDRGRELFPVRQIKLAEQQDHSQNLIDLPIIR